MSTRNIQAANQAQQAGVESTPKHPPPLNAGDHLSRVEFERRYQARPDIKKAELIEGIVYMPSPVHYHQHAKHNFNLVTWLGENHPATPGVRGCDNCMVRLDFENEVQPDVLLRLDSQLGGRSHITVDDYLEGPPELIVEVAASNAAYDLHEKRRVYARNGVQEYLVMQVYEQQINWFGLREGIYEALPLTPAGFLCSEIFPGLWLQPAAFWSGDLGELLATLQAGLDTPEHSAFVVSLQTRGAEEER
jgi:Uma2 family endonuclease